MNQERKETLMNCFPQTEQVFLDKMKGKGAANFVVFLTYGQELFARCYHRYTNGEIAERQRYVFAKDGACRYGLNNGNRWSICSRFREPVFCKCSYGYSFDNSYAVLGIENIKKSCMKYSEAYRYAGDMIMEYLKLYCKHPNVEYLVKANYDPFEVVCTGYWGGRTYLKESKLINWKSNNLLKMLNLNRTEFKLLKGHEYNYDSYVKWRETFPGTKPEDLITITKIFGDEHGTLKSLCDQTGIKPLKLAKYLDKQQIRTYDYCDYLDQCRTLEYNVLDKCISMPKDFHKMHSRLSGIIQYRKNEEVIKSFKSFVETRKRLEFRSGEFMIIQPQTYDSIIEEGTVLSHCVGGYAERHALGKLNIMFLRKADELDKPFYTVEVSKEGNIVQCRGYKNNVTRNGGSPKPQEIIDFEQEYQAYLDSLFKKVRKTA